MQVAIYTACNVTPIGCNGGFSGGGSFPVSVSVPLTPGTPYYLLIDSYAGDICDFTVTVSPPGAALVGLIDTQAIELCPGTTYTIGGVEYEAPAIVLDTLPNNSGACDTILVYNLIEVPFQTSETSISICEGDSIVINGMVYTESATIVDTLPSGGAGCDTIATYFLEVLPQVTTDTTLFYCAGDSVTLGG
ncbi:MAG: hypothetical protein KDC61_23480, partial [Saprospiraceae bacterium]|nr:hypothetical protein [Saprospiraceae bacterium]